MADAAALEAWRLLPWVLVNAGGDLRLIGDRTEQLEVGVEDPASERGSEESVSIPRRSRAGAPGNIRQSTYLCEAASPRGTDNLSVPLVAAGIALLVV